MINIIHNPESTVAIRGRSIADRGAYAHYETIQTTQAAAENEFEHLDCVWGSYVGAEVLTEGRIAVQTSCGCLPRFTSLDEHIATIDEVGRITRVSNGVARVRAKVRGVTYQFNAQVSLVGGQNLQLRLRYRDGSAGKAFVDFMDAAYEGASLGQRAMLSGGKDGIWNPSCWAIAAGIKVWPTIIYTTAHHSDDNPARGQQGGGTFIHPNFAICTAHFSSNIGNTVTCKDGDNNNHLRVVTDRFAPTKSSFGDWQILYFEEPMPPEVGFAKVLPDNWRDYFPSIQGPSIISGGVERVAGIPTIRRTRQNLTSVFDWYSQKNVIPAPSPEVECIKIFTSPSGNPYRDQYARWDDDYDAGNSSTGMNLVDPETGDLIFLAPVGGGNAAMTFMRELTEEWMDSKVPGATCTPVNLSGYQNYE